MFDKARWIAPAGAKAMCPCHFRVRRDIVLETVPEELCLKIAAESYYLLEINGRVVGRGPARGTRSMNFIDSYSVAQYFLPGRNHISVLVGCMNFACESAVPAEPALWLQLGDILGTDESWETVLCINEWPENGPLYTNMLGYAELRNCGAVDVPAETVVLSDESPVYKKLLLERETPLPVEHEWLAGDVPVVALVPPEPKTVENFAMLSTTEEHSAISPAVFKAVYELTLGGTHNVRLEPVEGGVTMVFDFAREISGRIEIELTASSGVIADLAYEEELWNGERLRADHSHTNPDYHFADRFILSDGRQKVGNLLIEHGFRMVQLTLRNFSGKPVVLHSVKAVDRRFPFAPKATFYCGDSKLNRLWDTARETLSACITDVFTDCPWRERLFYCNDMMVENRIALKLFGDYRLNRHAFRMIFSQMRPDGFYTSCCPSQASEKGFVPGEATFEVILSGNLTFPLVMWDYWMHTADLETVREYYPKLRQLMDKFHPWLDDGVLLPPREYWNFIDWSYELNGMDFTGRKSSMLTFLYLYARKVMRRLAAVVGDEILQSELEEEELIAAKARQLFWNSRLQCFNNTIGDGRATEEHLKALGVVVNYKLAPTSRLPHAFAILADAVQAEDREAVEAALLNDELMCPELYYWGFLLDAMAQCGKYKELLESIRKYWGPVLDSGSPTLWENGVYAQGKAGFGGSASLCHGFSSSPVAYLQQAVLGISPLEAGFRTFRFEPCCPEVGFAKGSVPTPFGAIRVFWKMADGRIDVTLTVPPECKAVTSVGTFEAGTSQFIIRYQGYNA